MKLVKGHERCFIKFGDVVAGECFTDQVKLFMAISVPRPYTGGLTPKMAVDLLEGTIINIDIDTLVVKIPDAHVVFDI